MSEPDATDSRDVLWADKESTGGRSTVNQRWRFVMI
jgi:hypothetical protein